MASSLADNHGNSSMSLDRQILQVARHQDIYSHFARCTWVPWHSLTSLVSCLVLVDGIHQWPAIQWFLFMLYLDTFICMTRIVPLGFVVGEDYTLFFMTPSVVAETWLHIYECTIVPLSSFHIFHYLSAAVQIPPLHITAVPAVTAAAAFTVTYSPWFSSSSSDSFTTHDPTVTVAVAVTHPTIQRHQLHSYCIVHLLFG